MLGSHQPRANLQTTRADLEVMETRAKRVPAEFLDTHPAAVGSKIHRQLLQADDAMHDAPARLLRVRAIVAKQGRAPAPRQFVPQGQCLAAEPPRIGGQEPNFREGIDHEPRRIDLVNRGVESLDRPGQLNLGRVEDRLMSLPVQQFTRIVMPSRDQPCDRAISPRSWSDSVVVRYKTRSPWLAPAMQNCRARVVLPEPCSPWSR
jgi:hypothetical protein